jgi:hypothetical protein
MENLSAPLLQEVRVLQLKSVFNHQKGKLTGKTCNDRYEVELLNGRLIYLERKEFLTIS